MKVIVKKKDKKGSKYPKLMKSTVGGCIVLFTSERIGFVCFGTDNNTLGEFFDSWAMECFEDFDGEVTLSND